MDIASDGIRLHVAKQGTGTPTLVFLHYWGGSSRTWRYVIAGLGAGFGAIAIDQRGWGRSDRPDSGYALADLADDAQGVIEALGLDRYILVGHSMGGKISQLLASRQTPWLAGLVLVAPSPPSPLAQPLDVREAMVDAYADRASIVATAEQVLTATKLGPDDRSGDRRSPGWRACGQSSVAAATSQEDITAAVGAITVPRLVISGAEDRVDPPAMLAEELLPRILQVKLHVLFGIGHLSPLEAPHDVAGLIRAFVSSLA